MKKILIVDDDNDIRRTLGEILEAEGFLTVQAADGLSAIVQCLNHNPDAVILDHQMPHMNGIETLDQIKLLNSGIPVIMLTGNTDLDVTQKALSRGAVEVIFKPPQFGKLILRVREVVAAM